MGLALLAAVAVALLLGGNGSQRAAADTSGPNASDYIWVDTNDPAPLITFDFIDATGGTLITSTDCDDCADTVSLPFTFNFFGTDYTAVDIGTNGLLSFDTGSNCNTNSNDDDNSIPNDDCSAGGFWGGNPLIAPWFDDLDPFDCGDIYYDTFGTAPNRTFVVQFNDVCLWACDCTAGEGVTFETILFEGSNDIKVQYMDAFFGTGGELVAEANNGGAATTGISRDGTTGLQYSFNETVLTDGLAVLYSTNFGVPTETTPDSPTIPEPETATSGEPETATSGEPETATGGVGTARTVTDSEDAVPDADTASEVTDGPSSGDTGQGTTDDETTDADVQTTSTDSGSSGGLPWLVVIAGAIAGALALMGAGSGLWLAYQRRRVR